MALSKLTPEDYGLKVRTHPGGLNVTAANKIRHSEKMQVSFSGHIVQTTIFLKDEVVHNENRDATDKWLRSLPTPAPVTPKARVVWNVKANHVTDFLENYKSHPLCRQSDGELLAQYVRKLNGFNELTDWTVVLVSNTESNATPSTLAGYGIGLIQRSERSDKKPGNDELYMLKKSNILSPLDEQLDLSEPQKAQALTDNINAFQNGLTRSKTPPKKASGPFIRAARSPQNGLLLLYPLDFSHLGKPFKKDKPILGFAISFPVSARGLSSAIEYQVNTKYWRDRYGEAEEDDDV
jgi:hypothetical protein